MISLLVVKINQKNAESLFPLRGINENMKMSTIGCQTNLLHLCVSFSDCQIKLLLRSICLCHFLYHFVVLYSYSFLCSWTLTRQTWLNVLFSSVHIAAVSCSPDVYRLGGVRFGFWLTGKLGCAWVVVHGTVAWRWCMHWCIALGVYIFSIK